MTVTLTNGEYSYSFPMNPQKWSLQTKPRTAKQKTLGGQVIQLLGYSIDGVISGYLHNHMVSKQEAWADMYMLRTFMANLMLNQRAGISTTLSWPERNLQLEVALGDLTTSESLTTNGFEYSIPFQALSKTGLKSANQASSMLQMLNKQIGWDPTSEFHGGGGDTSRIQQYTGFDNDGPYASEPTGTSGSGSTSSNSPGPQPLASGGSVREAQEYARAQMRNYGWSDADFNALVKLWNNESGWRYNAGNPSSGAYGIPQALPANKMAAAGADYRTNYKTQINWGLNYIKNRYGSPQKALAHWAAKVPINGRNVGHWY